jgi:hypothetical protein
MACVDGVRRFDGVVLLRARGEAARQRRRGRDSRPFLSSMLALLLLVELAARALLVLQEQLEFQVVQQMDLELVQHGVAAARRDGSHVDRASAARPRRKVACARQQLGRSGYAA